MGSPFLFLLSRTAAATAAVTVFLAAVFWTRAVKGRSVDDAEETHHGTDDDVPTIFLSHSGKQKAFVEHLYDALKGANHTAFFDKHTLPKGSPFPSLIKRAALGCKVGVVVLSEDFLTSKWPMLELKMLVLQRCPGAVVLPLYYKLHPEDLKSRKNLSKWRRVWKEKAGPEAENWERAVKALGPINGEVFVHRTSETTYINKVVRRICNLVSSPISSDLSSIQGRQRLAQEVAARFQELAARQAAGDKVCNMVGLYGVGGLGKTTMCKIMANHYISAYPGKCCHIEFPNDGEDQKIAQECKKALKKLTNLSDEHVLNKANSLDEVVQLMRENLSRYDVFLAIDNVWEGSVEATKRMLRVVSFSANSKVLLTSRSEEVLNDVLFMGHSNTNANIDVAPLPSPNQEEAFQIFRDNSEVGDLSSLVNRNLLASVLNRCFFSGNYHALALKALGRHVKRQCALEGLDKIEHNLSNILQGMGRRRSTALQNVEDLIRLSYSNLAEEKKHMFLDIVAVVMNAASNFRGGYEGFIIESHEVPYEKALQWLSFLYKKYDKSAITNLIAEMALDGLIQLENSTDDKIAEKRIRAHDLYFNEGRVEDYYMSAGKIIRVHDLYSDLAQRETARSARFFTDRSDKSVEEIEWERLERVILRVGRGTPHNHRLFIEKLQQQECRKLQVLCVAGGGTSSSFTLNVDLMPSLCVLKLRRATLTSINNWSAATGLTIVHLHHLECAAPLKPIPSILHCLEDVTIVDVRTVEGPPRLHGAGCQHLKKLVLAESSVFKKGEAASYFNSLTNLEWLRIGEFNSITRVLHLNALVNLQMLCIGSCQSVERIEGLDALKKLHWLFVVCCPYLRSIDGLSGLLQLEGISVGKTGLKKWPDLSGLTCLQSLDLWDHKSMEEVVGGLSPALKDVRVSGCEALKKLPDLSGLTCLQRLQLWDNKSMEEVVAVGGLSPALEYVSVRGCEALKKLPDLSGLTCLQSLKLCYNKSMEEVVAVGGLSPALKYVEFGGFEALKKLPDLSGLTCLQCLDVWDNESMEEVGGTYLSTHLKRLTITNCRSLRRFPSLTECVHLQVLSASARSFNDVYSEKMTNLQVLRLSKGEWNSIPRLLVSGITHLQRLTIEDCDSLLKLDAGCLPSNLTDLEVHNCEALEEIGDLSELSTLSMVTLQNCARLKKLGGFSVPPLEYLRLAGCASLEESSLPDMTSIPSLHIKDCGNLNDFQRQPSFAEVYKTED